MILSKILTSISLLVKSSMTNLTYMNNKNKYLFEHQPGVCLFFVTFCYRTPDQYSKTTFKKKDSIYD